MEELIYIFWFIIGTLIGSFLNVVSLRFNTGMTVGGRSRCLSCGNQLTWKELIPILSFLALRGACWKCKSKISWQYPLVEFSAGVIFTLIFFIFPPLTPLLATKTFTYIVVSCLLLVICAYDIKHKIIPDSFVYSFAAISFLSLFIGGQSWFHIPGVYSLLAGPILALPFALLWLVSKGNWMGLGDAKLVLGLGWLLGISGGINALVLSFWIAAIISIAWLLATYKKFKPGVEIPFGPYLILGFYIVLFFNIQVIDLSLF